MVFFYLFYLFCNVDNDTECMTTQFYLSPIQNWDLSFLLIVPATFALVSADSEQILLYLGKKCFFRQ